MTSLRILQLCNKPPVPATDGGCLAMLRMTEGFLAAGHQVTVLSIATVKHPWQPEKIPAQLLEQTKMDAVFIDTTVRWMPAFLALFKSSSYNIDRFYNLGFEARLIEILAANKFDIVQIESLYLCPYVHAIRRMSKAKIVMRAHNTESEIWKKNAAEEKDTFKKLWFKDLASKLERYEQKALQLVNAIVPITTEDETRLREMGAKVPMHVSTYAMKQSAVAEAAQATAGNDVFHIGSMDWKPNYDGVQWLLTEVWPRVLQKIPDAKLHLAGRAMNKNEYATFPGVIAHGEVEDAAKFMAEHGVMVIPLHSGGGVKVKMIEGMFARKAIVTTPVGAEGIAGKDGEHYLLATDAEKFAEHTVALLQNPARAQELGENAGKSAGENHELSRVTEKLSDFYRRILR